MFATDAILATLMCCTRSVYSWDIIVQRVGNKLFFDKRDDSEFDLLSVSETATEPPQDEGNSINSPRNLALEATFINHNFSQQVLRMVSFSFSLKGRKKTLFMLYIYGLMLTKSCINHFVICRIYFIIFLYIFRGMKSIALKNPTHSFKMMMFLI